MSDYAELVKGLRDCSRRNARVCMICGAKASNLCEGTKAKRMFYAADAIEELLAAFCLLCGICTSPPSDETFYSCEIVRGCLPEPPKEDADNG